MKTFTKPQGIEMSCLATGFEEWPSIKSSKRPHMLSLTARSQLWLQVTLILPWSWCGCRWEGNLAAIYYIYHLLIFLSWFCLSDLLGGVPFFPSAVHLHPSHNSVKKGDLPNREEITFRQGN